MDHVKIAAVVGAGVMGAGIAQEFARAGFQVILHDASEAAMRAARGRIEHSLEKFVSKGALAAGDREAILARVRPVSSLDAVAPADFIVEAAVEDVAVKRALFADLDRIARRGVILASNTSSIPIAMLAAATTRPGEVVGMHFMNPVPIMTLVELVRGRGTSEQTIQTTSAICRALGKTAIEAADSPGFIANRILMPMINEAAFALMEGVGTADAIDAVMTIGMRHPMGPLALADLIGIDVCVAILDVLRDGFNDRKYDACPLLRRMAADGALGRKTGRGFYRY